MESDERIKRNNPRRKPVPEIVRPNGPAAPASVAPKGSYQPPSTRDGVVVVGAPVRVGGARNAFGTRITKRVACARCGQADHVAFVPKDANRALCRTCAVEVLKAYEVGVQTPTPMQDLSCSLCHRAFQLPAKVENTGELLCRDCLRGFAVWQGPIGQAAEERSEQPLERKGRRVVARTPRPNGDS
jgi:hypothetical protein